MGYNPNFHNRRSYRLKGYDYSHAGLYLITICVKNKHCIFGDITDSEVVLSEIGKIANDCWLKIPDHFPNVELCEYIVMPNHIHGILHLKLDGCKSNKIIGNPGVGTSHVMSLQDFPNDNPSDDLIPQSEKSIPLENAILSPLPGKYFTSDFQTKFSKTIPGSNL